MALIGMAVYDTPNNNRTELTARTLESLMDTVDWHKHRLIISDNGSCPETHALYKNMHYIIEEVIYNGSNIGTANAINRAWSRRRHGEHCVKMDNDVTICQPDWTDWMEDVFDRDHTIGICGLKRKDLAECPWSDVEWYKSKVYMLPHKPGQRWLIVEEVQHVMGTCQAYSSRLLAHIGYLIQPSVYGFDDSLAAIRAKTLGFKSVFLHGFEIDHIDHGGDEYTEWKRRHAGQHMAEHNKLRDEYQSGKRPVKYNGGTRLTSWLKEQESV